MVFEKKKRGSALRVMATADTTGGRKKRKMIERHSLNRTFLKSTSWRVLATGTTILIAFILTGQLGTALRVGLPDFVVKFAVFYAHERVWLLPSMQAFSLLWKMVSWKIVAMSLSTTIAFVVTGSFAVALKLGPIDFGIKTLTFYLHEQAWGRISYGREIVAEGKDQ